MRYIIISMILLCVYLIAKASSISESSPKAILCGEIISSSGSPTAIHFDQWQNDFFDLKVTRWTTAFKNSKFSIEIPIEKLSRFSFVIDDMQFLGNFAGQGTLFLEPGDSIFMRIEKLDGSLSSIQFTGQGSEKLKALEEIGLIYARHSIVPNSPTQKARDVLSLKNEITESIDARKCGLSTPAYNTIRAARLEANISSFASLLIDEFKSNQDSARLLFAMMKNEFRPDEVLVTELPVIHFTRMFEEYALLEFFMNKNVNDINALRKDKLKMFNVLATVYNLHPIKEVILSNFVVQTLKHKGYSIEIQHLANLLTSNCDNNHLYFRKAMEIIESYKDKMLVKGNAYDFALRDTSGTIVSMKDFRGKVVILDFMYTGCGGCAMMAPHLEELETQYHGKNVEFISISVDKTLERFKKGTGKYSSSSSIKLFTNGEGANHEVIKFYDVIAYPTLVLIDKQGRIISARVSDPRTQQGKSELSRAIDLALQY